MGKWLGWEIPQKSLFDLTLSLSMYAYDDMKYLFRKEAHLALFLSETTLSVFDLFLEIIELIGHRYFEECFINFILYPIDMK